MNSINVNCCHDNCSRCFVIIDGYSSLFVNFPIWVRQDHHCYVLFWLLTVLYTLLFSLKFFESLSCEFTWLSKSWTNWYLLNLFLLYKTNNSAGFHWPLMMRLFFFLTFVSMGFGVWHVCLCCYFLCFKLFCHYVAICRNNCHGYMGNCMFKWLQSSSPSH